MEKPNLKLLRKLTHKGVTYPANEILNISEIKMDAETARWLVEDAKAAEWANDKPDQQPKDKTRNPLKTEPLTKSVEQARE